MAKKKLPSKIKKLVDSYLEILEKDKLPIKRAIVFGSYARGKPNSWSDLDVCIISSRFRDYGQAVDYLWQKKPFGSIIEPIGFNPKDFQDDDSFIKEIKNTGIVVK